MDKAGTRASTAATTAQRLELLSRLMDAGTPREGAAVVVSLAQAKSTCKTATVFWGLDGMQDPEREPPSPLDHDELALARSAATHAAPVFSMDGHRLAIPLFISLNPAILVLEIDAKADGQRFLDETTAQLELAGRHLCRALESADLQTSHTRLERSERLQRALFAISDMAGSDRDMPDMLRGIHAIVGTLMYAENFFIVLHEAERDTMRFLYFVDTEDKEPDDPDLEIPMRSRQRSLTWYLLHDGKPLMGNTEQLRSQISGPLAIVGPDSQDWLGVPMVRDGRVHGAIVVQSYQEDIGFSADDRTLLEFVGNHILIALERKQGKDDLEQRVRLRTIELAHANQVLQLEIVERQRAERLQGALFHIAQLATADISQEEFYGRVHAEVGELINAENFFIALVSEDGQTLEFPYYVDARQRGNRSRPLGRGLSEYVLRHGTSLMSTHAQVEALARAGEIDLQMTGPASVCWLGVPLIVTDEAIGLVAVQSYDAAVVYGPAEQELLGFVASQIANTLHRRHAAESLQQANAQLEQRVQERTQELRAEIGERERIQEQLKQQVMHDALTGLPNRGYLHDRLERVLAQFRRQPKRRYALLYLDVDRFKVINDSLGHLAGDQVLQEITRRLLTCVREPDVVARLAGDEFAILLEDIEIPGTTVKVAQRALTALSAPLQVAGKELQPSASIGIALADARYQSADEILRDADLALYRAKALGRNRFELFDASLQKNAVDVLAMEGELRLALQHDQFEPYFQPIMRLETSEVISYEALIRWNHPTRGLLAPGDFLRIAEDNGSIEAIDWRMFELSCRVGRQLGGPATRICINVSPLHLRRVGFGDQLLALLALTGMPPKQLVIEITEGSLLDDPERVGRLLDQLREAGVAATLDDFGTGYSSLSYLHNIPLRTLKIDRAFVARLGQPDRLDSTTVVSAVLAMARALGMQVVAEGIETEQQRDALMAMGCEFGQGYLLGRPAPASAWLRPD